MGSIKKLTEGNPSEYREYFNKEVVKLKGKKVLDIGRSSEWDYSEVFDDYTCFEKNEGNDILKNNLPSDTFDLVICVGMYENVSDPIGMISEINRVLKPKGKVLFGFTGLEYETNGSRYNGHELEGFKIIKSKNFRKEYHFIICKK